MQRQAVVYTGTRLDDPWYKYLQHRKLKLKIQKWYVKVAA